MRIHLIAIGGKIMHNLALELHAQGHHVTGSDDEIYEPAKSRLEQAGLLPSEIGWYPEFITDDINVIILGMHAHADNPELKRAQELGLKIESFPSFMYDAYKTKRRVVITGSHGKTTTTAMIVHALTAVNEDVDFLVGGELPSLDRMVRISATAMTAIIEGDEYLSSRIHPVPKMLLYNGNVVVLTGIDWDHMNVFPTYENYIDQFRTLLKNLEKDCTLVYAADDQAVVNLVAEFDHFQKIPYHPLKYKDGSVEYDAQTFPMRIFGEHNFANMSAALIVCQQLGLSSTDVLNAMSSFSGVGRRLEVIRDHNPKIYLDYAHAPSKVRATVEAVRQNHPNEKILALYELHTYSSMRADFLPHYQHTLDDADEIVIFLDEHALQMKRMPDLADTTISSAIAAKNPIQLIRSKSALEEYLQVNADNFDVLLFMSSGNFSGFDLDRLKK